MAEDTSLLSFHIFKWVEMEVRMTFYKMQLIDCNVPTKSYEQIPQVQSRYLLLQVFKAGKKIKAPWFAFFLNLQSLKILVF